MLSLFASRKSAIVAAAVALAASSSAALGGSYLTLSLEASLNGTSGWTNTLTGVTGTYYYRVVATLANTGTANTFAAGTQYDSITGWADSPQYGLNNVQFNITNTAGTSSLTSATLASGWNTLGFNSGAASSGSVTGIRAIQDSGVFAGIGAVTTLTPDAMVIASGTATSSTNSTFTLNASSLTGTIAALRWINTGAPINLQAQNYTLTASDLSASITGSDSLINFVGLSVTVGGGGATNGQYTLDVVGAPSRALAGSTISGLTAKITNTGTLTQDTLDFNTLTITGATGSAGSGSALAQGADSSSGSLSITASAVAGTDTLTPTASVTNTTAVGTPALTTNSQNVTVVASRTVNAPSTTSLGRLMSGSAVSAATNGVSYSYGSGGTGANANTEDSTVTFTAGADGNGVTLTGGAQLANSATPVAGSFGGTITGSGTTTGTFSSVSVTPEFSAGTSTSVGYTADVLSQRSVTLAAPVSLGIQHTGVDLSASSYNATISTSSGDDTSKTRVLVQGGATQFDGTGGLGTSQTRSFNGPASLTSNSGSLGSLTVTTNEAGSVGDATPYSNISVTYSAQVFNGNGTWTGGGSGTWGTHTNWTDGTNPGAPGTFTGFNADTATVNATAAIAINDNVHIASLNAASGTTTLTVAATKSLQVDSGITGSVGISNDGAVTIGGTAANLTSITGTASSITLDLGAGDNTGTQYAGIVTANAGAALTLDTIKQSSLTIGGTNPGDGAVVTIRNSNMTTAGGEFPGGNFPKGDDAKVIVLDSLNIANDGAAIGSRTYFGKLDLNNNDLIIRNGNLLDIENMLRSGNDSFAFDGTGITSSEAGLGALAGFVTLTAFQNCADPTVGPSSGPYYSEFDGIALTGGEIIVKFTWMGDLDLNGLVDDFDVALINGGFSGAVLPDGLPHAFFGDDDLSAVLDDFDVALLNGGIAGGGDHLSLPEPASLSVLALGAAGLLARRRRRA